jgi:phosphoribosyl-ATP pyrophosphohydrolase
MLPTNIFTFERKLYRDVFKMEIYTSILFDSRYTYIDYYNKEIMKKIIEEDNEITKELSDKQKEEIDFQLSNLLFSLDINFIVRNKDTMDTKDFLKNLKEVFDKINDVIMDKRVSYKLIHYLLVRFFMWCNTNDNTKKIYTWHCVSNLEELKLSMETLFTKEIERVAFEITF